LRDAQLAASQIDDEAAIRAKNADAYVEWGPLGRAFRSDLPSVVLIDEIDKVLTSHFVMKLVVHQDNFAWCESILVSYLI
jgi:hypothetical protein